MAEPSRDTNEAENEEAVNLDADSQEELGLEPMCDADSADVPEKEECDHLPDGRRRPGTGQREILRNPFPDD